MLLCMLFGMGTAWGQVTIAEFSNSKTDGWTINGDDMSYTTSGGGYYPLTYSDRSIVSPDIDWSKYKDITINISARKYGGPDETQGKISVTQGETELTNYSPTKTSIVASGDLSISPTSGAITISCPGASSNKGCGVNSITIKGTLNTNLVITTTTIDANGITNTNLFTGTTAGTLTATVKANDKAIEGATVTWTSSDENVATVEDGAVTLVAAGTTTITASYAGVEDEYEASEATYELTVTNNDPNGPGTENNPYTVAQARDAIDAGTGVTGVYATGIVSQVLTYNSSNGYINYYISTDGTTTSDQLEAYKGKSYDGANFTSKDDIQVGDKVVIYGNLTKYGTDTYEFAADNKLVSLVRPVNPAVETATTIDATGITNTDVYTSTAAGTLTATVTANNQAIADAIVTWTSSNDNVATVDANGAVTLVAAGTTTITASYAGVEEEYRASEATYELTVTNSDPDLPGTANNPYTVEQAIRAIDSGTGTTGVYVKGIVSTIVTPYNSQYGNISYKISYNGSLNIGQILAYRGKSYNGDNFTSEKDIQIGDEVIIFGNLTKYGEEYEFAQNNQLVSLKRPEEPVTETLTAVSDKMWDFSDWDAQTFNEKTIIDNSEINAASDKVIKITEHDKSIDGYNFTKRLQFGGKGSSTTRNVHFKVVGNSRITVYGMSGSAGSERSMNIDNGSSTVATLTNDGNDIDKVVYNYTGEEDVDIYLYSTNSGFNIYGIKVEPITGPVAPTVSFAEETLTVEIEKTATNTLTKPNDLTVAYSSSDPSIATVDENGIVTGVAVGSTTISATWAADETYLAGSKSYQVTVVEQIPLTKFIKVTDEKQLYAGNQYTIVSYRNNTTGKGYYAIGIQGTSSSVSGSNSVRDAIRLEESAVNSDASEVYIDSSSDLITLTLGGSNEAWTFTASDNNSLLGIKQSGNRLDSTTDNSLWTINSSDNGYTITNASQGYTDRTIQFNYNNGASRFASYASAQVPAYLYVKEGYTEAPVTDEPVDPTVTFEATDVTVNVGKTVTNAISGPSSLTYTYTTGNQAIATVNEEGVVTGVAIGTTTITAAWEATNKYNAGSVSYNVTVENKKEASATISAMNLEVGGAAETITTNPESLVVTYSTSDEAIATVSETGEVSGVAAGKATITVSWEEQVIEGVTYIAGRETFNVTVITPIQCVFEENYYTRFDFTQNGWGLPTDYTVEEGSFKNTGKTIQIAGSNGNGYRYNANSGSYLIVGKTGAYLTLPTFDFDVFAISVTGKSGASTGVRQNMYVEETAVSSETTGATGTNIYFIDKQFQAAGNAYTLKVNSNANTQITEIKVYKKDAFVEFAVTDAGYRTYCNAEGLDFSVATKGLTAYIIEGVDAEGSTNLVTKKVTNVPAKTGLLIQAEAGTYYVAKSEATATVVPTAETPVIITDDVKNNQLVGVVEATEIDPSIIVLMNGNEGVGFYKTSKTFTVGANTAYLPVSVLETVATASADSGVKTLSIFGTDDDTPTGINGIAADKLENAAIYNLSGQRVARPEKGIYIINGKKVLVK